MHLQKQNQNSIRHSLQAQLFPALQKNSLISAKVQPKRAIRAEDQLPQVLIPLRKIEREAETFSKKYQLGKVVGEGAHGIVKLGVNRESSAKVAVKICRSGDTELVATFTEAFKNARYLNHQFIIQVYECYIDEQSKTLYQVMEYSEMPSLEQILRVRKKLTEDQARAIMRSVLTAVKHMHERGVAHRDLKPDNILVQQIKQGDKGEVNYLQYYPIKVIDLGVSKKFKRYLGNEFRDVDMWTRTGTEFYTAPEIYQGGGYNEKVDLWSVGVTLYLVLAGELPFHGDTHSATIELILAGKFNLDHENFSRLVRDLLRRLLNPNPMSRLSATMALLHPWFYSSKKFDPISPNSDQKSPPQRASDDIYELPADDPYFGRCMHMRSNTITKTPSQTQAEKYLLQPQQCQPEDCELQSPLIKLKKIQDQINKEIHVNKCQQLEGGLQRIRMKLSQRDINKEQLNLIKD